MREFVVAVFAHNESKKILACLESIKVCSYGMNLHCYVLANGCTDDTCELVSRYNKDNDFVSLVEIGLPDKANAWNVFVHEISHHDGVHFFVDGDVEVMPDAFSELERGLASNPNVNAATAVPEDCGLSSKRQREYFIEHNGLCGNLYALSGKFIDRLRAKRVLLPIGLIGDDGWVGALAFWDLNPKGLWDKSKIIVCDKARFKYKPLSVFRITDLILHHKRKVRYSIRQFQNRMLHNPVKERGLDGIPRDIKQLYSMCLHDLKVKWRGFDTFYDLLAVNHIKGACKFENVHSAEPGADET